MKTSIVAGSVFAASLAAMALAAPIQAQLVSADVVIRSGPVRGHVVVDDGYSTYHRRPVVYERPARVIVVEHVYRHEHIRHWKRHGYRQARLFYVDGRYYDRYDLRHPGMREVIVYERDGRYYRDDDRDQYDRRDDYRDRDRDHSRHSTHDHDRWDD